MIVDIGGGSTEIAVISLGGIVSNNSIRIAGDDLTADIQEYMSRQHNVKVSERMDRRCGPRRGDFHPRHHRGHQPRGLVPDAGHGGRRRDSPHRHGAPQQYRALATHWQG